MLVNKNDINKIKNINLDSKILVLIFNEALGGFSAKLTSTKTLHYCGEYDCII